MGLFDSLSRGLKRSREALNEIFYFGGEVDESFWEDLEDTLVMGDMGADIAMSVSDDLRDLAAKNNRKTARQLREALAERLEENNVIVNYQATPEEEGFTASGALRMGVSEMTRFGFGPAEFDELAALMADCILRGKDISEDVVRLRSRFTKMHYCFNDAEFNAALDRFAGEIGF